MQPAIVDALACPHDLDTLTLEGRVLGCGSGHRFDLAKQGYATLIRRPLAHTGDPAPLIARRLRAYDAGLLDALHDAVVDAARAAAGAPAAHHQRDAPAAHHQRDAPAAHHQRDATAAHHQRDATAAHLQRDGTAGSPTAQGTAPGIICDLGSGPGTYLAAVLDALPGRAGLAIDASRAAARRAARCHRRAAAVVADVWDSLPVRDGTVALLLDVFAPRNLEEFARVLTPGGQLLVMTPATGHLAELREAFDLLDIQQDKQQRLVAQLERLPGVFETAERRRVAASIAVSPTQAADLAGMGASGHHLDEATLERTARHLAPRTPLTLEVTLHRLVRTGAAAPG